MNEMDLEDAEALKNMDIAQLRVQQVLEQRQKKLQKLAQQLEQKYSKFSFKPEINDYSFKKERDPFLQNVDAQARRKQELLEVNQQRKLESELKDATFKPEISAYSRALDRSDAPVHERLYQQGRVAAESLQAKAEEQAAQHIIRTTYLGSSFGGGDGAQKVDLERMYREAVEQRQKKRYMQDRREAQLELQREKFEQNLVTERSKQLVANKIEKELRQVFEQEALEQNLRSSRSSSGSNGASSSSHGELLINFVTLGNCLKSLGLFRANDGAHERRTEQEVKVHELLWSSMDPEETGWVDFDRFRRVLTPVFMSPEDIDTDEDTNGVLKQLQKEIRGLHYNKLVYSKNRKPAASSSSSASGTSSLAQSAVSNALGSSSSSLPSTMALLSPRQVNSSPSQNEPTFHPSINKKSAEIDAVRTSHEKDDDAASISAQSTATSTGSKSRARYQRLIEQHKKQRQKLEDERKRREEEDMRNCTFAPRINKNRPTALASSKQSQAADPIRQMVASGQLGVHNKLYFKAIEREQKKSMRQHVMTPREERELAQCTFQPNLDRTKNVRVSQQQQQQPPALGSIKGFNSVVDRMRKAQLLKEEQKQLEDNMRNAKNWSKEKTQFKPFKFELDKRQRQRALLFMDVNLGPGRTGRIGLHDGDDPRTVAWNFAQSYSLDEVLTKRLEELIRENMQKNGIRIGGTSSTGSARQLPLPQDFGLEDEDLDDVDNANDSLENIEQQEEEPIGDEEQTFESPSRDAGGEAPKLPEPPQESPSTEKLLESLQKLRAFTEKDEELELDDFE